jgi:hypothetical protein
VSGLPAVLCGRTAHGYLQFVFSVLILAGNSSYGWENELNDFYPTFIQTPEASHILGYSNLSRGGPLGAERLFRTKVSGSRLAISATAAVSATITGDIPAISIKPEHGVPMAYAMNKIL